MTLLKKRLMIINGRSIKFEEFQKKIELYRIEIKEKNIKEISLFPEKSFYFISLLWAALLEKIDIKIVFEKEEQILPNKREMKINETKESEYFNFDGDKNSFITFKDEKVTYNELKIFFEKITAKKIFDKSDVFYMGNKIEDLFGICLVYIFPVFINSGLVLNENLDISFEKYKATIFIGNRKELKKLHNLMMSLINKKKVLENFYYMFKNWDNGFFSICINKILFFNPYKKLRIVVVEDYKDLKSLWIDFESLGIEIYSENVMKKI